MFNDWCWWGHLEDCVSRNTSCRAPQVSLNCHQPIIPITCFWYFVNTDFDSALMMSKLTSWRFQLHEGHVTSANQVKEDKYVNSEKGFYVCGGIWYCSQNRMHTMVVQYIGKMLDLSRWFPPTPLCWKAWPGKKMLNPTLLKWALQFAVLLLLTS